MGNFLSTMGNSVRAHFNNSFGSNITHVANAYSTSQNEWIWICFHTTKLPLQSIQLAINMQPGASIETEWQRVTGYALMRIPYQGVHKKRRSQAWEHFTIISHDGTFLSHNYGIEANRSFIITRQGEIKAQKYGGNLWEDESGRNHYPRSKL